MGVIVCCACCTHLHILKFNWSLTKTSWFTDYSCDRHIYKVCSSTDGFIIRIGFQSSYCPSTLRLDIIFLWGTYCIPNSTYIGIINDPLSPVFLSKASKRCRAFIVIFFFTPIFFKLDPLTMDFIYFPGLHPLQPLQPFSYWTVIFSSSWVTCYLLYIHHFFSL